MKYKKKKMAFNMFKSLLIFTALSATYNGFDNIIKEHVIHELKSEDLKITDFDFFKVKNLEKTIEEKTGLEFVFKDGFLTIPDLTGYKEILSKEYIATSEGTKSANELRTSQTSMRFDKDGNIERYESAFFKKDHNLLRLDVSNNKDSNNKYIVREIIINNISEEEAKKISSTGNVKYEQYIEGVDYFYLSGEKQELIYKVYQLENLSYYTTINNSNDFYEMKYELKPYENVINSIIQTFFFMYFIFAIPFVFSEKHIKGSTINLKMFNRKAKKENEKHLKEIIKQNALNKRQNENNQEIKQKIKIENE